jgi:hypothetical protein
MGALMSPKKISDLSSTAEQHLWSAVAERLRDGPLQALVALYFKAMTVAKDIETVPTDRLQQLGDLVRLAQTATERFQEFTAEVQALIDELAAHERRPK